MLQQNAVRSPREAGFSFLEVMISMTVVTIGFLGTLALLIATMKADASTRSMSKAVSLAQARAEKARSVGFTALAQSDSDLCIGVSGIEDYGTIKVPLSVAGNCATVDPAAAGYRRETLVTQTGNLKTVTVTVRWRVRDQDHNVQLSTLVAQ